MVKTDIKLSNRVLALALAVLILAATFPFSAFTTFAEEVVPSTLTTDIGDKTFVVGAEQEFYFETTANDDAGKMVLGSFEFSDESAVEKLYYWDVNTEAWREFEGDFGPAETGFPLANARSRFKAVFNKAGVYTIEAYMKEFGSDPVVKVCSVTETVTVRGTSTLTTTIGETSFVVGKPSEFTFTTTPNGDAGKMVLGSFVFSDNSAIQKLEYWDVNTETWQVFNGDFGPAETGFPLTEATSRFRATFNKAGTYSVTGMMKTFEGSIVLCSVDATVTVLDTGKVTTNLGEVNFVVGRPTEFTVTTIPNADENTMVLGAFTFSDLSAIGKLEYWDVNTNTWQAFMGDFGPATTGFPMINTTSRFRVTFVKTGDYTANISIKKFGTDPVEVLCSVEKTITVKEQSVITTDVDLKDYVYGEYQQFTVTTIPNGDAGRMVLGTFYFDDPSAIDTLEYWDVNTNTWKAFMGDFGLATTGFPLTDATSQFRVKFAKSGDFAVTIGIKLFGTDEYLCTTSTEISVENAKIEGVTVTPVSDVIFNENVYKVTDLIKVEGTEEGDIVLYGFTADGEFKTADQFVVDAANTAFTAAGKYNIYVKVQRPYHDDFVTADAVVAEVKKANIEGVSASAKEDIVFNDGIYNVEELITVSGIRENGDTVLYGFAADGEFKTAADFVVDTANSGITAAGDYYIFVRVVRDNYNTFTTEEAIKVTVKKAEITGVTVTAVEGVIFKEGEYNVEDLIKVEGTREDDTVLYSFEKNGEYKTADQFDVDATEGDITSAGAYDIYVKVVRANYNDLVTEDPVTAVVEKAEFVVSATAYEGIYDKEEHEIIVGAIEGGEERDTMSYKKGEDELEGKPMVKDVADSGTYYITVRRSKNYYDQTITVEVKISQSEQTIVFEETPEKITYKADNSFTYVIDTFKGKDSAGEEFDAKDDSDNTVTYEIVAEDTTAAATIESATGKVTYTSVGTIKVKASVPECANYKGAETEYTVEIYYIDNPTFVMPEADYVDDEGVLWYKDDVVLNAPEGFEIVEDTNAVDATQWADKITKTEEGKYPEVKVSFKNIETGDITAIYTIPAFAIDKTAPEITNFTVKGVHESILKKIVHFFTFGIFGNDNLAVTVTAIDENTSSDIKVIKLYDDEGNVIAEAKTVKYDAETKTMTATFKVTEDKLGKDERVDLVLHAEAWDNVGNKSEDTYISKENSGYDKPESIMLETKAPVISDIKDELVDTKGVVYQVTEDDVKINVYNGDIKFSFSAEDVDSGLYTVDVKVNGKSYEGYPKCYEDEDAATTDKQKYTITTEGITAAEDGSYTFEIIVVDNAGNQTVSESVKVYKDETAPIITGFQFSYVDEEGNEVVIDNEAIKDFDKKEAAEGQEAPIFEYDDYGYYFNENIKVVIGASDIASANEYASGVKKIIYKAIGLDGTVEYQGTIDVENKTPEVEFEIEKDFKGQIFAYAVDNVENNAPEGNKFFDKGENDKYDPDANSTELVKDGDLEGYVFPNGTILETPGSHENEENHIVIEKPETTFTQNDGTELYANDVDVTVTVKDEYAGIRTVEWFVIAPINLDNNNYSGKLTVDNNGKIHYEENSGEADWSIEKTENNLATILKNTLTVKNNSNDIVVKIIITDRSYNVTEQEIKFGIDKTAPTIEVVYDNNTPDEQYTHIYKDNRTATITITERNFRAEDVEFLITNTDGIIPNVNLKDAATWTTTVNAENPDLTTHVATILYAADGDYTFDIAYTDNAGNKAAEFDQHRFTIDKTLPVVRVEYDNNSAKNGNYYKANRMATITIIEHNFDPARVHIIGSASDDGTPITFPALTEWINNGDTHVANIAYIEDAKYSFDIEFRDMAGNSIEDFATQEFYVDKTLPKLVITGIVDKSANNYDGQIGFVMTATDTNFDVFTPVLKAIFMKDGQFVAETLEVGGIENIKNGQVYTVSNLETDGIYNITCTLVDKAGNEFQKVILQDASGVEYTEERNAASTLVEFSVNRNGSVFGLDAFTSELVKTYYVKNVTSDVTIFEINADEIVNNTITLNGKKLTEGTDYTVSLEHSTGTWFKYTYKIKKAVFESESEYNVIVATKDRATNDAFSDVKDVTVKFVVDRTAPVVTIGGIKKDGRYQVEEQTVTLVPSDDGGSLKSLIVRTVDKNGNVIKEILNLSGDELLDAIANGAITFVLGSGYGQNVQIICEDIAGNVIGAEDDEVHSNITITTNAFLYYWANEALRWSVIGGILLVIAAVVVFVVAKKKKKAQ